MTVMSAYQESRYKCQTSTITCLLHLVAEDIPGRQAMNLPIVVPFSPFYSHQIMLFHFLRSFASSSQALSVPCHIAINVHVVWSRIHRLRPRRNLYHVHTFAGSTTIFSQESQSLHGATGSHRLIFTLNLFNFGMNRNYRYITPFSSTSCI